MSLTKILKAEPYFKVSNILDSADLDYALNRLREIERIFGDRKSIDRIKGKILIKKSKLND